MNAYDSTIQTVFVDTNIWLYAFITGAEEDKTTLAQAVIQREAYIIISTQVINEVSVNLLKKTSIGEHNIREIIASFYQRYHVVEFNLAILVSASNIREHYNLSYWDSLIIASALSAGASIMYSEDMQNGLIVDGKLKIINPFNTYP